MSNALTIKRLQAENDHLRGLVNEQGESPAPNADAEKVVSGLVAWFNDFSDSWQAGKEDDAAWRAAFKLVGRGK